MPMSLKTKGFPETQAGFARVRELVRTDATRSAVRVGGAVMVEEMKEGAPVLDEKNAGSNALEPNALKTGIGLRVEPVRDGLVIAFIGPKRGTRRVAHLVEYGHRLIKGGKSYVTAAGAQGPGKLIGEVPAHPFLRPAFETSWQRSIEAFAAELKVQLARFSS